MTGYVLQYTVIPAKGEPQIVDATNHLEAVGQVVKNADLMWRNKDAAYEPVHGEVITVIGQTQDEYRDHSWYDSRRSALQEQAKGKGAKAKQAKDRLAELVVPEAPQRIVTFKLNQVTKIQPEYLSGLPTQTTLTDLD